MSKSPSALSEDLWEAALREFGEAADEEALAWSQLARCPDKIRAFLSWTCDNAIRFRAIGVDNAVEVLRRACEKIAATELAADGDLAPLEAALRRIATELDPGTIALLQARRIEVPGAAGAGLRNRRQAGGEAAPDLNATIAAAMSPEQVAETALYLLRTESVAAETAYAALERLLSPRDDRSELASRIEATLAEESATASEDGTLRARWPRLADVLRGRLADRFVGRPITPPSATSPGPAPDAAWLKECFEHRMSEMRRSAILRRKAEVLVAVLDREQHDPNYEATTAELERMIPQLLVYEEYLAIAAALRALSAHAADGSQRRGRQPEIAGGVLDRFFVEKTLRQLVRDSLGRADDGLDAVVELLLLGGVRSVPVLLELLASEETRRVRLQLVRLLSSMGPAVVRDAVTRLGDERWYVIRNLVLIIGEIGDGRLLPHLSPIIRHPDRRVRTEAARALVKTGGESVVAALLEGLADDDLEVRLICIHGLGLLGGRESAERLEEIAARTNWWGRRTAEIQAAVIALGRRGERSSIALLEGLARPPRAFARRRSAVRRAAGWALATLRGEGGSPAPEPDVVRDLRPREGVELDIPGDEGVAGASPRTGAAKSHDGGPHG